MILSYFIVKINNIIYNSQKDNKEMIYEKLNDKENLKPFVSPPI